MAGARFAKATGQLARTDRIDADSLALFAEHPPGQDTVCTATQLERHEASEVVNCGGDRSVRHLGEFRGDERVYRLDSADRSYRRRLACHTVREQYQQAAHATQALVAT